METNDKWYLVHTVNFDEGEILTKTQNLEKAEKIKKEWIEETIGFGYQEDMSCDICHFESKELMENYIIWRNTLTYSENFK